MVIIATGRLFCHVFINRNVKTKIFSYGLFYFIGCFSADKIVVAEYRMVTKIGSDTTIRITSETERDIAASMWAGNNRILFVKDTGGDENYQLYGVNIDGSDLKSYINFPKVRTNIIDPLEKIDSLVIIGMNKRNPQVFDPYRLNLNTGELTLLAENPGNIQGWMTDHDGKLRVAIAIVDGINK